MAVPVAGSRSSATLPHFFSRPNNAETNDETNSNELWRSTCHAFVCWDGVVDAPEQCDDGNAYQGDGCTERCIESEKDG